MKKTILIGIVIALMVLGSGVVFAAGVGDPCQGPANCDTGLTCVAGYCWNPGTDVTQTQTCDSSNCIGGVCDGNICRISAQIAPQPAPTAEQKAPTYNVEKDKDGKPVITNGAYTFTSPDNTNKITIPTYLLQTTDPTKFNAEFNTDGTFTITVDTKGKGSQLDKGKWVVTPSANGYIYTLVDEENHEKQVFELVQSGGNNILIEDYPENTEGYLLDPQGNEQKWLGKIPSCDEATYNCYPTGNKAGGPIIFTKCKEGTECQKRGLLATWLTKDTCYYGGQQADYDSATGKCYGITKNVDWNADVVVVGTDGKSETVNFDCTEAKGSYKNCKCSSQDLATCNKVQSEVRTQNIEKGFAAGLGMAGNVGQFIDLGRNYGWWKTDESFMLYETLFEKSVLLRQILEPERTICELNSAYSDLLTEGFLPTSDGKSGADIQAERYKVTEINTKTGKEEKSSYRYKVTFDVNGAYILKPSQTDSSGKPLYEYKTSFTVYLDSTNITGEIELSTKGTPSYGTTNVGHPLVIGSQKYFSKACIKFHDTGDMDPYVQGYLSENGNQVCNDIEDAYVPSVGELISGQGGGGGGGGGQGQYEIPPGEVTV